MELPVSSWNKTLEALGFRKVASRHREQRILPRPAPLHLESLEARWTPSASVSMAWANGTSVEGQFQAITLRLSEPSIDPVTVTLALGRESTANSSDVWLNESVVTIEPGRSVATVIATFWIDARDEATETVVIEIASAGGAEISANSVFVGEVQNAALGSKLGGGGTSNGTAGAGGTDEQPLQPPPGGGVQVNFGITQGEADEGYLLEPTLILNKPSLQTVIAVLMANDFTAIVGADYSFSQTVVSFAPGETVKKARVIHTTDSLNEVDESYGLRIVSATNATIGPSNSFLGVVVDVTPLPSAYVIVRGAVAAEGSELKFQVQLQGNPAAFTGPVTVTYQIDDSRTAKENLDFRRVNTEVTLSWDHPIDYFRIDALRDAFDEGTEDFYLTGVHADGLNVQYADPNWYGHSTLGVISNTEAPKLYLDNVYLTEGQSGQMTARLSYAADVDSEFNYLSKDATAKVLTGDYFTVKGKINFPAGQTYAYINVNSRADAALGEPDEFYVVNADHGTPDEFGTATDGNNAAGKVYILDLGYTNQPVDLAIDSDNNNSIGNTDDQIEDEPGKPGKFVPVNDGDFDGDGKIGWADFQDVGNFVPVDLRVNAQVNWSTATFSIQYDASDPNSITSSGGTFHRASGALRLWSVDASSTRAPARLASGGNFILPGVYTAAQLGFSETQRNVRIFVEGIIASSGLGASSIAFSVVPYQGGPTYTDRIRTTTLSVDLDVDSDNDLTVERTEEEEDQLEFLEDKPGKIVVANRLDFNADGVPGFADGINRYGNEGDSRSFDFAEAKLSLPATVNRNVARVRIEYLAADPALVSRTPEEIGIGELAEYEPGSDNPIRIWTRDGSQDRRLEPLSDDGHFVPASTYAASDIFTYSTLGESRGVLYLEGISESELGAVEIVISVDPDGNAGNAGYVVSDRVRLSVAHLQIAYADVSGITGTATDIQRIEPDVEPDGLTADWQEGVEDGSLLLMRVVASQFLYDLYEADPTRLTIAFGEIDVTYKSLTERNGLYTKLDDAAFFAESRFAERGADAGAAALDSLQIDGIGDEFGTSGRYVLDARFFRPPNEFDIEESATGLGFKSRDIDLAIFVGGLIETVGSKPNAITLARAPIVIVHGINSDPTTWDDFVNNFDGRDTGWHVNHFRVDHSGIDPSFAAPGATFGNGELTSVFRFVQIGLDRAAKTFRAGAIKFFDEASKRERQDILFEGLNDGVRRIAIQKSDIVAHSYGGLLARWYMEQASLANGAHGSLFESRRDVRKLITLGTPHKGSPFANLVAEAYKGGLFAESFIWGQNGIGQLKVRNLLETMQSGDDPFYTGQTVGNRNVIRPSYEALAVNSDILMILNSSPFHADVGYAAVIGTDITFDTNHWAINDPVDLYQFLTPISDVEQNLYNRALFPWLKVLNPGADATDSVVPVWSAKLGVDNFNAFVEANHGEIPSNATARSIVARWLNGFDSGGTRAPMPLGTAHRAQFVQQGTPVSERNAYVGSTFNGTISSGAGVNRNAIVKVELNPSVPDSDSTYGVYRATQNPDPSFENAYVFGTAADQVGVQPTALTGMIQWKHRNQVRLAIVSDEAVNDNVLHDLGTVNSTQLNFNPVDLVGIQGDDWISFRVLDGRIGRRHDQVLTGPDGVSGNDQWNQWVAYHLAVNGGITAAPSVSGHSRVVLPEFELPSPLKLSADGLTLRLTGSAQARNVGMGDQVNHIYLWDDDGLFADEMLTQYSLTITHASGIWDGLLIGYSFNASLSKDANGNIAGLIGSSFETQAEVYQQLIEPDLLWGVESAAILVGGDDGP